MERPSSRGSMALSSSGVLKAPTGSPVATPERPSTSNRSAGMGPPGTSAGRQSTAAGFRPAAGSLLAQQPPGTGYKRLNTAVTQGPPGTATSRQVQVDARPLTQQGISGMRTAAAGGRQVLDKAFFLGLLKTRRAEVAAATGELEEDAAGADQRQAAAARLDKRVAELQADVKAQQEKLSQLTMVLDKAGSHTPLAALAQEHAALKERNTQQQARADDIVSARLAAEQKTRQAEARITEIQRGQESQLRSLTPAARQQYSALLEERQALRQDAGRLDEALAELEREVGSAEGELGRNVLKQRALELQEQIRALADKKYELQAEEDRSSLSPEEQREQLLARIKRDNAEMERTAAAIRETQEQSKRLEALLEASQGGSNSSEEASRREKYNELCTKERDLAAFVDSFPARRAIKYQEVADGQAQVAAALERIGRLQALAAGGLPSAGQFRELQDELQYKKMQLENSQATAARLQDELVARRAELAKVEELPAKVADEMGSISSRLQSLKTDLARISDVPGAQRTAEESKQQLEQQRQELTGRRADLSVALAEREAELAQLRHALAQSPLAASLERLEQRISTVEAEVSEMRAYISSQQGSQGSGALVGEIRSMAEELNGMVIKAVATT